MGFKNAVSNILTSVKALLKRKSLSNSMLSIGECLELANDEIYVRSQGTATNRAYKFFSDRDRVRRLSDFLAEYLGLTEFKYLGSGDNAVVVQYADRQVLRLRAPEDKSVPSSRYVVSTPFVCPIFKEIHIDGGRLNFVPFIRSLRDFVACDEVNATDAKAYIHCIVRRGLTNIPPMWFFDYKRQGYKFEQVGLLSDGTPIVIDQGAVILEQDTPSHKLKQLEADRLASIHTTPPLGLTWDGKWSDASGAPKFEELERPLQEIIDAPGLVP